MTTTTITDTDPGQETDAATLIEMIEWGTEVHCHYERNTMPLTTPTFDDVLDAVMEAADAADLYAEIVERNSRDSASWQEAATVALNLGSLRLWSEDNAIYLSIRGDRGELYRVCFTNAPLAVIAHAATGIILSMEAS